MPIPPFQSRLCADPPAASCRRHIQHLGALRPPAAAIRGQAVIPAAENLHNSGRRSLAMNCADGLQRDLTERELF